MRARMLPGLAIATALSLTGCMADDFQANSGTGRVAVDVSVNSDVKDAAISRATASTINADDLMIRLSSEDGSFSREWKLNEFPSNGEYVIGNYLMEAYYGTVDNEGFNNPHYYGSTTFQIKHNQTSSVSLLVGLGNSMITLGFEESFKNYLTDFSALLTTSSGKTHTYAATDEGKPIYVKPGNVSLSLNCTLPTGKSGTFNITDFTVEPKYNYNMTLGINIGDHSNPNAGAGSVQVTVKFDDSLDQEPIEIELSDDLFNAPSPTITPSFDTTKTITLPEGSSATETLAMTLLAQGDFANVVLTTDSPTLFKQGWPREIDLMTASATDRDNIKNLGLKVLGLYQNPEQMAQLDFTDVIQHLSFIEGESNNNTFTVKVTDKSGKSSEPTSFTVATTQIKCEILSHYMMVASDNLQLRLSYSGENAQENVSITYMTQAGSYTNFTTNSFTDNGDGTYSYDLNTTVAPKDPTYITVKILYNGKELIKKLDCGYPEFSVSAYDSFATYALFDLSSDYASQAQLDQVLFSISKDGGSFTSVTPTKVAGTNHLMVTGLTPSSSYTIKGTLYTKDSNTNASFTTEAASQLPNNGMEEWMYEQPTTENQRVYYPGSTKDTPWTTMNLTTTSTSGTGGIAGVNGSAYRAHSGTQPVTAQGISPKVGSNAAYISTVGWGSKNTALGTTVGKCENITAGTLSLDNYTFGSRPKSMSFYYKYTPKNSSDYGCAEIKVLDASGNVICSKYQQLSSAGDWTLITLDLSYPIDAKKSASIAVGFKSSDNSACLEYKSENITLPTAGAANRYKGSELCVDEITLNY